MNKEFIDNKLRYYLKPTDSPASRFYDQPNIHKPRVHICPYICPHKDQNDNARNSATFSNYNRNVPIEDEEIMVTFDVTFLYTVIPITDTLNTIKNYVNNDDQFTRKTAISRVKFLDLFNLLLTTSITNKFVVLQ